MYFFFQQFLFLATVVFVLFVPGSVFLYSFFRTRFSLLEMFVFSLPLSIALVTFLLIFLGTFGIPLTAPSIIISISLGALFCLILGKYAATKHSSLQESTSSMLSFSKRQGKLILLILLLTVCIKTVYLEKTILPTSTDLGHHMYWVADIVATQQLPIYVERNIIENNGTYTLDAPEPIDDFIIGEHLLFAAIAIIAKLSVLSSFPSLILLLINTFSLLAVFVWVVRAFPKHKAIALVTLFFLGPLYTISSPQAKFVSGGVVGNTIGNLFIPFILYSYWRALKERDSKLLALAFFLTFALAYIHHLSTLIFLYIFACTIILFIAMRFLFLSKYLFEWWHLLKKPVVWLTLISAVIFFTCILAPSYADPRSIHTALGTPTKVTREGLSFLQLSFSTGEGRLGLGIAGLFLFLVFSSFHKTSQKNTSFPSIQKKYYTKAFFGAWGLVLLLMSLKPNWLFLNIPSNRIGSYAVFPFSFLAAFAFVHIFSSYSKSTFAKSSFIVMITFFITGGLYDNAQSLAENTHAQTVVQTYAVSRYLANHTNADDLILKDHNYIAADSWMKLFFLRGYTYPLSRGLLRRYDDPATPREQCTLWMIAIPNTPNGQKCFNETEVDTIVVNPHFDSAQFHKSAQFSAIYRSDDIVVYKRK